MIDIDAMTAVFGEPTRYVFDESNAPLVPARCLDVGDVIMVDDKTHKITGIRRVSAIGDHALDTYTFDDGTEIELLWSTMVKLIIAQGDSSTRFIRAIRADGNALLSMTDVVHA